VDRGLLGAALKACPNTEVLSQARQEPLPRESRRAMDLNAQAFAFAKTDGPTAGLDESGCGKK